MLNATRVPAKVALLVCFHLCFVIFIGISWKEQKRRNEVLNHNPANWIDIQ
jgi:type VI protein secretion system component VasF